MITALIVGAITGWLMSMPIGPINAAAISRTLKYSYSYGLAIGAGAAVMDIIYCGGAAQINQFLIASPVFELGFELVGFVALLWLGIHQFSSKTLAGDSHKKERSSHERSYALLKQSIEGPQEKITEAAMKRMGTIVPVKIENKNLFGPFAIGVVLYATNIMAIPEWIIVSGLWRSWGVLGVGFGINVAFALGAGVGTLGWFITLTRWISRKHRGFEPATVSKINLGMGIAMLVFAAYFGYKILFGTNWHEVTKHTKQNTDQLIDSI